MSDGSGFNLAKTLGALAADLDAVKSSSVTLYKDWENSNQQWSIFLTNDGLTFVKNIEALALDTSVAILDFLGKIKNNPTLEILAKYSPIVGLIASLHSTVNDIKEAGEAANEKLGLL